MNKIIISLIILILIPVASANSVIRTISHTPVIASNGEVMYESLNITLIPAPYSDFSLPGYVVTEYLPSGAVFMNTNADNYSINGSKLFMLKFAPGEQNYKLWYTVKIQNRVGTYTFFGTYKDKERVSGEIAAQSIELIPSKPTTPTPQKTTGSSDDPPTNLIQAIDSGTIQALQKAYDSEQEIVEDKRYVAFILLSIMAVIVCFLTYKKYKARKVEQETLETPQPDQEEIFELK